MSAARREYLYYIMELADDHVAGRRIDISNYVPRTLKAEIDRQRQLSASESIQLGVSLTEALGKLHQHGLTHRDIKPSNMIFINGVPKLADIGLVAATGQRSFVGTEGYVPPEGPGTPQADVFSLGKVLYEVSTGKDRLDFPELDSRLTGRGGQEEDLLRLNDVLINACSGDLRLRYPSAGAMHDDLLRLAAGEEVKVRRSVAGRWILVAAFLIALAIIGSIIFLKNRGGSSFGGTPSQDNHSNRASRGARCHRRSRQQESGYFREPGSSKIQRSSHGPGYDPVETAA